MTTFNRRNLSDWEDTKSLLYGFNLPANFTARVPVPPFLASITPQPTEAPKSAIAVGAARASHVHKPATRGEVPACIAALKPVEPPTPKPPKIEPVEAPVKLAPMVLSLTDALAWKQAREQAYVPVALYSNRYDWRTGKTEPHKLKAAA